MGTSLCISRSVCASTRQFPDRFVRCASACTVQVFSINALLKSLCLCVSVCLWPPLLVKRVTALEVESQWWCESPQPVSATSCIYVCVRWRDQNPVLSFVTRGGLLCCWDQSGVWSVLGCDIFWLSRSKLKWGVCYVWLKLPLHCRPIGGGETITKITFQTSSCIKKKDCSF